MKGIILSGGSGTRLHPITKSVTKQLLPIYDKPLIYYPLSTLMEFNIKEILIIVKNSDLKLFKNLLGNGIQFGISIKYEIQTKPRGIAEALKIGKKFIGNDSVALILGDNIFYGINNKYIFPKGLDNFNGAKILLYRVPDPERYGVANIKKNKIISIVEKPKNYLSNYAVTGLYFYDNSVLKIVDFLKPSKRNELEITDVNNAYLKKNYLSFHIMEQGSVWMDAGTERSLLQASLYVQTVQDRQNIQIASPEIISLKKQWITRKEYKMLLKKLSNNNYSSFLKKVK